ncbi:MAG: histidinol-phosphate aminotransferase family protein [Crocinitomicaceae bacterium]|nr:histidinol-phosphate aminotransferase family protein [Crocinitomicaceae bacterium]
MLKGHGDDLHNFEEIQYNFSSNVFFEGCRLELIKELQNFVGSAVNNYPSPVAYELSICAAERFRMGPKKFLFFNGATEALYTIAQLFNRQSATIFAPTFAEYEGACDVHKIQIDWKTRNEFHQVNTNLAFICNPNNPDGSIVSIDKIELFLKQNTQTTLVVDEAYIEFTNTIDSVVHLCNEYKNLIVVRSLTKVFAIPGIRLGYVISNDKLIEKLKACKMPWSVNSMAIKAGECIFQNYDRWHFSIQSIMIEMQAFLSKLSMVDYLELMPTHTTYVLARLKKGKASELKQYLAKKHKILIRDATNFTKLRGECIRISLQSKEANEFLIEALNKW